MTNNERLRSAESPKRNIMQRVLAWAGISKSVDEVPVETIDTTTDVGARLADAGVKPSQLGALFNANQSREDVAPPIVETDRTKSLRYHMVDYHHFKHGSKRVTIFLEEGETLVEPPSDDRDLKTFDGIVEGLDYFTIFDIEEVQGHQRTIAISQTIYNQFRTDEHDPDSADSYQEFYRRGLTQPNLELVHVVTGIDEAGCGITFFGVRTPDQQQT